MDQNRYIESVKRKNPRLFAGKKIQMTPAALENAIRGAFEAGRLSRDDWTDKSLFGKVFGKD